MKSLADGQPNFHAMAELRYQIRRFLRFSEKAARQEGLEPQQHQLLLAIKGLPAGLKPTITTLAERMQLRHHSTIGLIDRLVEREFLVRLRATDDRRQVLVKLTPEGENCLHRIARHHFHELRSAGPKFVHILRTLIDAAYFSTDTLNRTDPPLALNKKTRRDQRDG